MRQRVLLLLLSFLLLLSPAAFPSSLDGPYRGTFSVYVENDYFAGTDRGYTSGMKVTWLSSRLLSVSFGQNIFTPYDITQDRLTRDDRPYAGISYIGIGFHTLSHRHMQTIEFSIGVVGPSSYAEDMQKFFHSILDNAEPQGWRFQLKDEFVIGFSYDYKWKVLHWNVQDGLGVDLINRLGGSLSNAVTASNLGLELRMGWNLPHDLGTFLIRPGGDSNVIIDTKNRRQFGLHVFAAVDGHAVVRNIFLDGNTFQKSHRVDKEPFTADILFGAALTAGRFKLSYTHVYRTKQYRTQRQVQMYGSINLSLSF